MPHAMALSKLASDLMLTANANLWVSWMAAWRRFKVATSGGPTAPRRADLALKWLDFGPQGLADLAPTDE